MLLRTSILSLLLALAFVAAAQSTREIDSLKVALRASAQDTQRVRILYELSTEYWSNTPDSALAYADRSLALSQRLGDTKGEADALLQRGRLRRDQYQQEPALADMQAALKLYRAIHHQVQIANTLNDISILYANADDNPHALEYFGQALAIFRQMGDLKGESYALNNIGIIYHQGMDDPDKAMEYFQASLAIKEKIKDNYGIPRSYSNLGAISEDRENWEEALMYYRKAEVLFAALHDDAASATNYNAIARVLMSQGRYDEAYTNVSLALQKATKAKGLFAAWRSSKMLASLEEKRGNLRQALYYQKQAYDLNDSLNAQRHESRVEEMRARFSAEEQQREIELLKKDQVIREAELSRRNLLTYVLLGGILVAVVVAGGIYYAYWLARRRRDELALKSQEIALQRDDLDRLNKEKDRFFSILSHDLRGPLAALKGLSYLLTHHMDVLTHDEVQQIKSKIDVSLDNLTGLINNILEWSMASSRKRRQLLDKVSTQEVIQKNISLYQPIAENKGVNLVYEAHTETFGYTDYHALDTVIRNLLSNSIKFSHANQDVVISVKKDADKVAISVRDHGIGMSPEVQERLFTLDTAVRQAGTQQEKGLGIGLALCKELMEENQGDIRVNSQPGKGSEFIVSIPEYHG